MFLGSIDGYVYLLICLFNRLVFKKLMNGVWQILMTSFICVGQAIDL